MNLGLADFVTIWPSLGLSAVILLTVLWDALVENPRYKAWGNFGGAAALLGLIVASYYYPPQGSAFFGVYVADAWTLFLQRVTWGLGIITLLGGAERAHRIIPRRQGEQVFPDPRQPARHDALVRRSRSHLAARVLRADGDPAVRSRGDREAGCDR
ncbi:MAG: hypothetical protein QM784_07990 [Polyangiaceae bacterium]